MSANKDIDKIHADFISTVSHELRTPLTSIRGFAQTLIDSHDKLTQEQQLKFLSIIKDQSNRLINLVENLLSASAQASSEEIYILKPVNILQSTEKILTVIKQKYPRKDFELNIPAFIDDIFVDTDKFEQILLNIIENACKYSYENSIVKINAKSKENQIAILIENDGAVIDSENIEKIFEKFVRLDSPMTRLTQGSGMGLYLAKKMTEKMNGKIEVLSENEHTIFTLMFPVATTENITQDKLKAVKND